MDTQATRLLLVLSVTSLLMMALSLWMAWSVCREVRRLVGRLGDDMEHLIRKQTEALQEVAGVTTAEPASTGKAESPSVAASARWSDG